MDWLISTGTEEKSSFQNVSPLTHHMEERWNPGFLSAFSSSWSASDLKEHFLNCALPDSASEDEREKFLLEYIASECPAQDTNFFEILRGTTETEVSQDYLVNDFPLSAITAVNNFECFQKIDLPLLNSLDQNQRDSSQVICEGYPVVERPFTTEQVPNKPAFLKGDGNSTECIGKKSRGRPPKYQKWVEELSESPFVLNNYKRRRPRKYKDRKYSKYCHICNRSIRRVPLYHCANVEKGLCKKALCLFCIGEYRIIVENGKEGSKEFICPHCTSSCPEKAQCRTYLKTNLRRRAQVLISRK